MTAERWLEVKAIFNRAVECDPAAREEFIRQCCGTDAELRREVENLLASDESTGALLHEHPGIQDVMAAARRLDKMEPGPTTVLKDRYQIERELGRGGMSVVYLARDRQLLAKRVVVKVLLDSSRADPWTRQKFLQEMEALTRIDHPGVVGVLDTGLTPEGEQFLVMQYIEGQTLRSALQSGSLPARAAGLIRQIGQALAAAHEKGIWHRDLKPENIMLQRLGSEDHIKLIDFGIAAIQNSQFTVEKTKIVGSLAYMAPEQMTGNACAASDTYALAVLSCEMLTGTLPGPSAELPPELPRPARKSIMKALSFRPELRHAEVREFSEELYDALTARPSGLPPHKSTAPGTVEIAHVLFTDLVGYSLLPMDRQKEYLEQLQETVRESPQFRAAESCGEIISLPTGDGMALAFFGDPTAPAQCALELAGSLKSKPHLKLRMGIHSGPVYRVADVNANVNCAGGGINLAQRVMDCGDAGHILVSKNVADLLLQFSNWAPYLTDLGECTVKHGVKVHLYNLATAELGNPEPPRKLVATSPKARFKAALTGVLGLTALAVVAGAFWFGRGGKSSPPVPIQPSIAVLPFVDLSPEKNQGYFSEGLADELLSALAKIPSLRVAARTSSFRFGGRVEDSRSIGKKLNVATILEGSVRKQGNRGRINVQLIQASTGFHLWSETYNKDLNDILTVQEEIARAVTGALNVTLVQGKSARAESTNAEAHNTYLQGRFFFTRPNRENMFKAIGYFEQTIKLDPGYARGWLGLGASRSALAGAGYIPAKDGYRMAREALEHALALDPSLGEAHSAIGWIQMQFDWDWAGADASFKQAVKLEPGNAFVIDGAASLAGTLGRVQEAVTLYERARQIDPLNLNVFVNSGLALYYAGLLDDAKAVLWNALELVPETILAHGLLGRVYLAKGEPREALAEMEKEKDPSGRLFGLALAYHALGRKEQSDQRLAELIKKYQEDSVYQIAAVYGYRGEKDKAFEWLDRAYAARDAGLNELKCDPLLKNLRVDQRYAALIKKMGLPE